MPYKDKEAKREYARQYRQDHKEERNKKSDCPCGGKYVEKSKARHMRTLIHQKWQQDALEKGQ